MIKILFLIHDLGRGGAEKVLVNLVNAMDRQKFDITLIALFGGGVMEQNLRKDIRYITVFKKMIPGNSKIMKLFSPQLLHKWFVRDKYDIEVSYLEGPSARVISGCRDADTRRINWIHGEQRSRKAAAVSFRSEKEAEQCYARFDRHVFVAATVKENFLSLFPQTAPCEVLYNTVESDRILSMSDEPVTEIVEDGAVRLVSTGTLKAVKGFDRLLRIVKRLREDGRNVHLYLLGKGPLEEDLKEYVRENGLEKQVTFLGYQTNPYKYVKKCDLFVCSSHREGFSTAATEALIVGTPVCTTEVSGMKEMLGGNNEHGLITENDEAALYRGIVSLLENRDLLAAYKEKAEQRGKRFSKTQTVEAVELFLQEAVKK